MHKISLTFISEYNQTYHNTLSCLLSTSYSVLIKILVRTAQLVDWYSEVPGFEGCDQTQKNFKILVTREVSRSLDLLHNEYQLRPLGPPCFGLMSRKVPVLGQSLL